VNMLDHAQQTSPDHHFRFACHPGVSCFTECCRELDLALTPYDTLRLKHRLGISSGKFLDTYVVVEWDEQQTFPLCYLTMVDDGRASCVFVTQEGCSVYPDRPGSCRAYPVGRGATRKENGTIEESLIVLHEPHCRGFEETTKQHVGEYLDDQGLASYRQYNDALLPLLQHPLIQTGRFKPNRLQLNQYLLALYDLDQFRQQMNEGRITLNRPLTPRQLLGLTGSDEELLLLGLQWLMQEWAFK
jgi:uncharacterized protein